MSALFFAVKNAANSQFHISFVLKYEAAAESSPIFLTVLNSR